MQLDYNIEKIYPAWKRGAHGSPIVSREMICSKITLYKQYVCNNVNKEFGTSFKPLTEQKIEPELANKIHDYLMKKENHYVGLYGDNTHELANEYWGWDR